MIIPTFVNFTVAFTPIVAVILTWGTVTTFMVVYLFFNGISEFGGINWEAVFVSVIAAACFASFVLSFVNNLFIIVFGIATVVFTFLVFMGGLTLLFGGIK